MAERGSGRRRTDGPDGVHALPDQRGYFYNFGVSNDGKITERRLVDDKLVENQRDIKDLDVLDNPEDAEYIEHLLDFDDDGELEDYLTGEKEFDPEDPRSKLVEKLREKSGYNDFEDKLREKMGVNKLHDKVDELAKPINDAKQKVEDKINEHIPLPGGLNASDLTDPKGAAKDLAKRELEKKAGSWLLEKFGASTLAEFFATPAGWVTILVVVVIVVLLGIGLMVYGAMKANEEPASDPAPTSTYTPPADVLKYCGTDHGFYTTSQAMRIFGSSRSRVAAQLVRVKFPTTNGYVLVHKKAAPCYEQVGKEIVASGIKYKMVNGGTFNWRVKAGGGSLSMHSFGIALDINVGANPWRGGRPGACKTNIPPEIVSIFKKYGFSWGGDWRSVCDAMHFEWHGAEKRTR